MDWLTIAVICLATLVIFGGLNVVVDRRTRRGVPTEQIVAARSDVRRQQLHGRILTAVYVVIFTFAGFAGSGSYRFTLAFAMMLITTAWGAQTSFTALTSVFAGFVLTPYTVADRFPDLISEVSRCSGHSSI